MEVYRKRGSNNFNDGKVALFYMRDHSTPEIVQVMSIENLLLRIDLKYLEFREIFGAEPGQPTNSKDMQSICSRSYVDFMRDGSHFEGHSTLMDGHEFLEQVTKAHEMTDLYEEFKSLSLKLSEKDDL